MTQTTLNDFMTARRAAEYATQSGTKTHDILRHVIIDGDTEIGPADIITKIKSNSELTQYFTATAMTEVPVAGKIRGKFISRRIDRMIINHDTHTIKILDYKTDINTTERRNDYITQLREYAKLMHEIYPTYVISTAILWTHDWRLEILNLNA